MDDAQVVAFENQRQPAKQSEGAGPDRGIGEDLRDHAAAAVERLDPAMKPGVAVLLLTAEQVQLVVSQDALGQAGRQQFGDKRDDSGAIHTAVGQVAEKNKPSPLWVPAVARVAEVAEQRQQGIKFAVDVGDDIKR